MKIAVIGATGRTGREVVRQARARGHEVIAVARSPERLRVSGDGVTAVAADAHDGEALRRAVEGSEAIVSTLGAAAGRERTDVYSAGIANLLRAMDGGWARRLAVISAAPVGPREQQPAVFRLLVGPILDRLFGGAYADMRRMEHELERRRDVEWTCLRPPRLVTRPPGGYRLDRRPLPRTRTLTYPDLAAALLDCVDGPEARTGMLYVAG
ncbi:MAG TPA: NAD(P)H-binding protein [Solirubrobacteraceae bacterium]|nr:NAD(P)H-binding protein [Solirubrobacteraceae bacterium]